ncbi:MAG: TIGR03936 family radical SAM-associated protein [Saccharofermentanales bacterium]|nr:DUF2344 domain-containing protein [Clostridiaceae bacterium]
MAGEISVSVGKNKEAEKTTVIRMRFARSGPPVWLAHLDLMRTFERSVRRAALPIAYTRGFNPRPQLTFALPLGVGLATEDDYVDLTMLEPIDPQSAVDQLNLFLPSGLTVLTGGVVSAKDPSLMSLIQAAEYLLEGQGISAAAKRIAGLPQGQPWLVEKNQKGNMVTVDIRPLLMDMYDESLDRLFIQVKAGSKSNLRPKLFLDALVRLGGLNPLAAADTAITRTKLLIADGSGGLKSPLPRSGAFRQR